MATTSEILAPLDGSSLYQEQLKTAGDNNLDKDAFLNLLVAQMKYQNPLEPVSNTESVAQLAQFSALEQMTNVANAQKQGNAYSLIGKYVIGEKYTEATGTSEMVYGVVSSVKQSGNEFFVVVDGVDLPLANVQQVTDTNYDALGTINSNIATNQSLALIGKNIQAVLTDSSGNITKFVEGTVDYVKVSNGRTVLMVNDVEVFAEEVMLVSDEKRLLGTKEVTAVGKDADGNEVKTTGAISDIVFVDNEPHLVIGGKKFKIDTISDITEAINLLGKNVDTKDVKGYVSEVVIKNGAAYVIVGGEEVKLETVRKAMTESGVSVEDDTTGAAGETDTDDTTEPADETDTTN